MLLYNASKAAIDKNIGTELAAGKSTKQAAAIALHVARKAGAKTPRPKIPGAKPPKAKHPKVKLDTSVKGMASHFKKFL